MTKNLDASSSNLKNILANPPEDIIKMAATPLAVGQPVLGDSIAHLGSGPANESRMKGIAKVLGGIVVSTGLTMAAKAAITMVAAAAMPSVAPIVVPAAFLAWSAYKLSQSAIEIKKDLDKESDGFKSKGNGAVKAYMMALNQNKFKAGLFLGSAVMLALSATQTLDKAMHAISGAYQNMTAPPPLAVDPPLPQSQLSQCVEQAVKANTDGYEFNREVSKFYGEGEFIGGSKWVGPYDIGVGVRLPGVKLPGELFENELLISVGNRGMFPDSTVREMTIIDVKNLSGKFNDAALFPGKYANPELVHEVKETTKKIITSIQSCMKLPGPR